MKTTAKILEKIIKTVKAGKVKKLKKLLQSKNLRKD